jgi:very-short-patch-repair endonuclease
MANEYARYLRKNKTSAERRLWRELRPLEQVGFKFRQQVPIDRFIVDFACLSQRSSLRSMGVRTAQRRSCGKMLCESDTSGIKASAFCDFGMRM